MNLKKHFSLNRFSKYLKYDLVLNGKTYFFSIIGFILILVFIQFYILSTSRIPDYLLKSTTSHSQALLASTFYYLDKYYKGFFFFTFIIGIVICSGTSFPALRTSRKSISYLLLPISNLEKVIVQILFRIVVFGSLFILLYWVTFKFAYNLYDLFEWENKIELDLRKQGLFSFFNGFTTRLDKITAFLSIISLAAFSLAGAVYFKKYALFKTILAFGILIFLWYLFMVLFTHLFYPSSTRDFFDIHVDRHKINKDLEASQLLAYIFGIASSLFLFPLAYFKFKEKEV